MDKAWNFGYDNLIIKKPPKNIKKVIPKEQDEQFAAVAWLKLKNIPFYHIPNGGYRNPIDGAKFKRLGVSAGVPDICVTLARKGYHGLYIEIKRVYGGRLSDSQIAWRDILVQNGYCWFEAKGAEECIKFVENYLK